MCTVIPTDFAKPHEMPMSYSAFNDILSCVQICSKAPDSQGIQFIRPATAPATEPAYQYIYKELTKHPQHCHFVVEDSAYYVSCLQAMMLWCLMEEERAICIYIVDPTFNRPAGWSYRYFWRHQAKCHKIGMSIEHVGIIAKEAATVCNVKF